MSCKRLEDDPILAELGGTLDTHVEQCDECRERLRGYTRIADLIAREVTAHGTPPGWRQRTLARVRATRRPRPGRRIPARVVVAGAAVAVLLLFFIARKPSERTDAPALAMQIVKGEGWRGDAHLGDEVRARALRGGASHFEIRVYRGTRELVVRCPEAGPPACLEPDRSLLVWKLGSVATYQVLLLVSDRPIPAPRGSLNDDVAAATASGARVIDVQTIPVR